MDLTDKVLAIFEAHKNEGDVEVEIRLGKHNGSLFDTNVGKDVWKRVLTGLKKFDGWESTKTTTSLSPTPTTTPSTNSALPVTYYLP